jgi:hypothetical protein
MGLVAAHISGSSEAKLIKKLLKTTKIAKAEILR